MATAEIIDQPKQGSSTSRKGIGVGTIQLKWLKSELEMSEKAGERVIVASHDPILEGELSAGLICFLTVDLQHIEEWRALACWL